MGHGRNRRLVCESCGNGLGLVDDIAEGFKVFKWAISVPSAGRAAQFFSVQKWVAATVLHEVETTGARKYIVREEGADGARDSLLVSFGSSLPCCVSANYRSRFGFSRLTYTSPVVCRAETAQTQRAQCECSGSHLRPTRRAARSSNRPRNSSYQRRYIRRSIKR